MTPAELISYESEKELTEKKDAQIRRLHALIFPEAYEFMGDSIYEAKQRKKGINPMRHELVLEINKRRKLLGVSKLKLNGKEEDNSALVQCEKLLDSVGVRVIEEVLQLTESDYSYNFWETFSKNDISINSLLTHLKYYVVEK